MNDNHRLSVQWHSLWRHSYTRRLFESGVQWSNELWAKLPGKLHFTIPWHFIIEGLLITVIIFMPVLSAGTAGGSWGILIPLVLLLWLVNPAQHELDAKEPHPAGFIFLWVTLAASALLSRTFGAEQAVLLRFGSWFTLAWLTGRVFTGKIIERILKYLTFSSVIWLIIGFWQLFSGMHTPKGWLGAGQADIIPVRIYSVFGNPNIFALYLLSILVFCHYFLTKYAVKRERIIFTGIFAAVLAALHFTYSRMAWLITGIFILFRFNKQWRYALLCVGFGLVLLFFVPGFQARVTSLMTLSDSSFQYRIQIWRGVWQALQDNWLWGTGPDSFQRVYPEFQIGRSPSQHAHQFYLQFWLEYGLFSLMAFLAVLKRILMPGRVRAWGEVSLIPPLTVSILIFLAYGLSETWYIQSFCGGYFWFLTGLLLAARKNGY